VGSARRILETLFRNARRMVDRLSAKLYLFSVGVQYPHGVFSQRVIVYYWQVLTINPGEKSVSQYETW
jgi:hypothetical protein